MHASNVCTAAAKSSSKGYQQSDVPLVLVVSVFSARVGTSHEYRAQVERDHRNEPMTPGTTWHNGPLIMEGS